MSVQVSHVQGDAIGSGRTPLLVFELEVMNRGLSADSKFLRVWAESTELVRGRRDSDPEEGLVVVWNSSSESRVRSMALLLTLSFTAFSASLWASAPDAQAVLSRLLSSAAYKYPPKSNGRGRKKRGITRKFDRNFPATIAKK